MPLLCGTLVTSLIALLVAVPLGTIIAIYLSQFAPTWAREVIKPVLELLSAVPTVVYGYFALLFVTPLLQTLIPSLPGFNMLSAGLVMGIMIIPYVSSLSEDAMQAVPMLLREGAYACGANKLTTALRVVFPAAISAIGASYILAISRAVGETMIVAVAAGLQPNLTFLRFNILAFIKAQRDASQTIGGLFRELAEEIGLIKFQDRIVAYFRQFLAATVKMLQRSLPASARFGEVLDTIDIVINELDISQGCET